MVEETGVPAGFRLSQQKKGTRETIPPRVPLLEISTIPLIPPAFRTIMIMYSRYCIVKPYKNFNYLFFLQNISFQPFPKGLLTTDFLVFRFLKGEK
jgi:hypothetical protein